MVSGRSSSVAAPSRAKRRKPRGDCVLYPHADHLVAMLSVFTILRIRTCVYSENMICSQRGDLLLDVNPLFGKRITVEKGRTKPSPIRDSNKNQSRTV